MNHPVTGTRFLKQAELVGRLLASLPAHRVLHAREDTKPYESDGLSAYREVPGVVAIPENDDEVAFILKTCHALKIPVVARGSGTGLSGGALPMADGLLLSLAKMKRILSIDPVARVARVQPGVRNLAVSEAAAPYGLYYAPDPSSQIACSIGGNVAENSGGVHCLKYGLTVHNILRVRGFTVEGEPIEFGSEALDVAGLDLIALVCGSEGKRQMARPAKDDFSPRERFAACVRQSAQSIFANTDDCNPRIRHAPCPAVGRHHRSIRPCPCAGDGRGSGGVFLCRAHGPSGCPAFAHPDWRVWRA